MRHRFFETAFTSAVRALQAKYGSRDAYARAAQDLSADPVTGFTEDERAFIGQRDSFYLSTVSETGWPYVQHRGGPRGFVLAIDDRTLVWGEFNGNRQYVSLGNAAMNDRVAMIFVDYAAKARLKVLGRVTVVDLADRPALAETLKAGDYPARPRFAMRVTVEAFDWNCSQHITPRFTAAEVVEAMAPLEREISELRSALGRGE